MPELFPNLSAGAWRWVRFGLLVIALGVACWIAYRLSTVFTPVVAAAALAYLLNPLVTWCERHRRMPRLMTVIVAFALLGAVLLGGGLYAGSKALAQVAEFQESVPAHVEAIGNWVSMVRTRFHPASTSAPASAASTIPAQLSAWWGWAAPLVREHGVAVARSVLDTLGAACANMANLLSLLVLIPVFTFYFLWRFNELVQLIHDHLPAVWRDEIVHVVKTIDSAIASFFRGRLMVCLIDGLLMAVGWSLAGVPYSLLLGALTAILSLVPFLSLLALPPALLFTFLAASQSGAPWLWPVVLAMAVFLAVQAVESFALIPAIQGQASGLHPLMIVIALLIGGQLAGVLGLLLAIPVASTLKVLAARWLLPEIRRLAAAPTEQPGGGAAA
jgi:predicted PurR-regulated permease PerM